MERATVNGVELEYEVVGAGEPVLLISPVLADGFVPLVREAVLAEGIEVKGAWLDNGLLHIDLARPQPEVRVRTIEISKPGRTVDGTPERG